MNKEKWALKGVWSLTRNVLMEVGRDHFQTVLIIMEVEKEQFSNIEGQSFGAM